MMAIGFAVHETAPWLTCRRCEALKDFTLTELHDFETRVCERDPAKTRDEPATDREWLEARESILDRDALNL